MTRSKQFLLLSAAGSLLLPQFGGGVALGQTGTQRTQERPGTTVAYTTEAVATVESIDQHSREVLLRGAGGRLFSVKAGPAVENLARVKAGDRVVVRYVEALAASLAKPGQGGGDTAVEQGGVARHAPAGSRPTGTVGNQIRTTVTIDAIDRATHTVTFTGPANAARTVAVKDAEAQRFLGTLKPGDRVDLVYTESLAVAVEPMGK